MRKQKNNNPAFPYIVSLAVGYAVTLAAAALGALLLSFTNGASENAWIAALIASAAGSFFCGRSAGLIKKRQGLKVGALCGIFYMLPLILLSLIFRRIGGFLLIVKVLICIILSCAGAVMGVNANQS